MLQLLVFLALAGLMLLVTFASIPTLFVNLALGYAMLFCVALFTPILKVLSDRVSDSW